MLVITPKNVNFAIEFSQGIFLLFKMNDIINQKERASLYFRYAMYYGLQLGIILFFMIITYLWGLSSGLSAGIAHILLLITPFVIYFYMKKYRKDVLTNQITYSQAWSFGNTTFFFASLIAAMGIYLFFEYFSPESLPMLFEHSRKMMAEVLQQEVPPVSADPIEIAISSLMSLCVIGMIISAIVAIFARKKNPQPLNS